VQAPDLYCDPSHKTKYIPHRSYAMAQPPIIKYVHNSKTLSDITLIHRSLKFKNISKYTLMCPTVSRLCFAGDALVHHIFWVSSGLILILAYLAVVTYIIVSTRIVTKYCQHTSCFHVYCLTCSHRNSNPYPFILP
jgi:hypothetical protein